MAGGEVTPRLKLATGYETVGQEGQTQGTQQAQGTHPLPCMSLHQDGSMHEWVPITGGL